MLPVIIAAVSLTVVAAAITVHAFLKAEDGFEDDEGFHAIITPESQAAPETKAEDNLPPLFPEPHSH